MLRPQWNEIRKIFDLGGIWELEVKGEKRPIAVPASWNEQYQDLCYEEGPVVYRKAFYVPSDLKGKNIRMYFGAVNTDSVVYINGNKLGENHIGYLPFEVDITDSVKFDEENVLEVKVENHLKTDSFPAGRTPPEDLLIGSPNSFPATNFDFFPYGGIIRDVKLEICDPERIVDVFVDTSGSRPEEGLGVVRIDVEVSESSIGKVLEMEFASEREEIEITKDSVEFEFKLGNARFWKLDDPYLYGLRLKMRDGEKLLDSYELKVGIRPIGWDEKRLYLNGEPIFLKGFGKHEEFPVLGQGTFYPMMIKDYNLLKWIGANSFRTSHYPYSEEWLDLADELGILVIDEAPHVGVTRHHYNPETEKLAVENVKRMIDRDKNHSSVIMWSVANEPESNHPKAEGFFKALYEAAKQTDKTRPVTLVSCLDHPDERTRDVALKYFDIISINRYYGWYIFQGKIEEGLKALDEDVEKLYGRHKKPVIVTEFGADAISGYHYDPPQMFSEEYQAELVEKTIGLLRGKEYVVGTHVWAFADFKTPQNVRRPIYNHKGVFTRTREPKLVAHVLRRLWNDCN